MPQPVFERTDFKFWKVVNLQIIFELSDNFNCACIGDATVLLYITDLFPCLVWYFTTQMSMFNTIIEKNGVQKTMLSTSPQPSLSLSCPCDSFGVQL